MDGNPSKSRRGEAGALREGPVDLRRPPNAWELPQAAGPAPGRTNSNLGGSGRLDGNPSKSRWGCYLPVLTRLASTTPATNLPPPHMGEGGGKGTWGGVLLPQREFRLSKRRLINSGRQINPFFKRRSKLESFGLLRKVIKSQQAIMFLTFNRNRTFVGCYKEGRCY